MKNVLFSFIKTHLFPLLLLCIVCTLWWTNYAPGTFLSGWDTLHPEFNYGLNLQRLINGVFRPEQGLGAVAAHSHMADLPRVFLLMLLDLFLPTSMIRYAYIFLCLLMGPVGMYFFLKFQMSNVKCQMSNEQQNIFNNSTTEQSNNETIEQWNNRAMYPAFLGSLFYLLNIGTMQQFIVPFEMFTTLYAALPWLFLFATQYLLTTEKRAQRHILLLFALTTLLATPMAYAATLWYAYFLLFLVYLVTLSLVNTFITRKISTTYNRREEFPISNAKFQMSKKSLFGNWKLEIRNLKFAKFFILITVTLAINSFWLLPNLYFIANHSQSIQSARINELFSPQAFLYNKAFGDLFHILTLKSFLFDWSVYAGNNRFDQLLKPWIAFANHPGVAVIHYFLAGIAGIGLISICLPIVIRLINKGFKTENGSGKMENGYGKWNIESRTSVFHTPISITNFQFPITTFSLLPLLIIVLFFLINDNFPTGWLYSFFNNHIPLFEEAFRFPHTKFYIPFIFLYTVFFAIGIYVLLKQFSILNFQFSTKSQFLKFEFLNSENSLKIKNLKLKIATALICLILFLQSLPSFQGHLVSPYMRVKIPEEYFRVFQWFDSQTNQGKIATLPIHSFWGWEYYDWGFQGAGFSWFGIKQPMLVRDFDRWNRSNEQYYREMSYAIYTQNPTLLRNVLQKYAIGYILVDKHVLAPQLPKEILFYEQTEQLLKQPYIAKVAAFSPQLSVYKVTLPTSSGVVKAYTETSSALQVYEDPLFASYGNYVSPTNPSTPLLKTDSSFSSAEIFKQANDGIHVTLPEKNLVSTDMMAQYVASEKNFFTNITATKHPTSLTLKLFPYFPFTNSSQRLAPITTTFALPEERKNLVVSMNHSDLFDISDPTEDTPYTLGNFFLNNERSVPLSVYALEDGMTIFPNTKELPIDMGPCSGAQPNQQYTMVPSPDGKGLMLTLKSTVLCLTIPFSRLVADVPSNKPELLVSTRLAFTAQPNPSQKITACIISIKTGVCQGKTITDISQPFSLPIQKQQFAQLGMRIVIDTSHVQRQTTIVFPSLAFRFTAPFYSTELPAHSINTTALQKETTVTTNHMLLPFSGKQELHTDITTIPNTTVTCSQSPLQNNQRVSKHIVSATKQAIRYTAENGVLCDHFSYPNLSHDAAYLVFVTSKNSNGLPLTFCMTNYQSKRCDIYAQLSDTNTVSTNVFLLPPMATAHQTGTQGYDINIGSLGVPKTPGINELYSIAIVPFPYNWLTTLATPSQNDTPPTTVFMQPYSFEKGWQAYVISNFKCQISNVKCNGEKILPFIFGKKLNQHVLTNGWANGWVLDNNQQSTVNNQLVLIFWPQYLEYGGFLLLFGTFTFLILRKSV